MIDQKQIVGVVEKLSGEIFCSKSERDPIVADDGAADVAIAEIDCRLAETKVNCVVMEIEPSQPARS